MQVERARLVGAARRDCAMPGEAIAAQRNRFANSKECVVPSETVFP
jgi:hypothetical protein